MHATSSTKKNNNNNRQANSTQASRGANQKAKAASPKPAQAKKSLANTIAQLPPAKKRQIASALHEAAVGAQGFTRPNRGSVQGRRKREFRVAWDPTCFQPPTDSGDAAGDSGCPNGRRPHASHTTLKMSKGGVVHPIMKEGVKVAPITYCATAAEYGQKAVGIAKGAMFGGSAVEHEFVRNDGRHVMMRGREFVAPVEFITGDDATTFGNSQLGGSAGNFPVSLDPNSIGGRIDLLSKGFECFKFRSLKLVYAPSVPATRAGAIAMSYDPDVGSMNLDVGMGQVEHLASGPFATGQVWEEFSLPIDPEAAANSYWDDDTGDFRLVSQGQVSVWSMGGIETGATAGVIETMGNIYLEYEVEFYRPRLEHNIAVVPTGHLYWTYGVATANTATNCVLAATAAGANPILTMLGSLTATDLNSYILCMTLVEKIETTLRTDPTFRVSGDDLVRAFEPGTQLYARFADNAPPAGGYMFLFATLNAAANATLIVPGSGFPASDGQLLQAATIAAGSVSDVAYWFTYRGIEVVNDA